jgi:lipopolysaccharide/colanic/teichoic acid biosynthesis glycosyltransferase
MPHGGVLVSFREGFAALASYPEFDPDVEQLLPEIPIALERPRRAPVRAGVRPAAWKAIAIAERLGALILLLLLLPGLAMAALTIILLSGRSPLIAHTRVGRGGCEIRVLKLRTMWGSADAGRRRAWVVEHLPDQPVPELKTPCDPRVQNTFSAACRKYSIDELPQLWQVVRGDLSLVGPRPVTSSELAEHYGPEAEEVLRLTPGLTGLWQIMGRDGLSYRQRRRLDLFLVRNWSFRLYAFILLATIPRVITGRDAW